MEQELICYEELDSTNAELKRLAEKGIATDGTVVLAAVQTAGRGRRGRVWHSPDNGSLYMSVHVRPDFDIEKASMLTLLMAYGVSDVLKRQGVDVQIKWPNDLVVSGKKVCGILTELHELEDVGHYLIIGVGVNLSKEKLPKELQEVATSIDAETEIHSERTVLAKMIAARFRELYQQFQTEQSLAFIKDKYNEILVNKNRQVRVLDPAGEYCGLAYGIEDDGRLLVEKDDGEMVHVFAGEVSVRGIYGYV